jgi:flagellar biosynthetic protein FliR
MDLAPIARIGLLLVRPGVLIIVAPSFGGTYAPAQVKIGLTVLLALALLPSTTTALPPSTGELAILVMREAAIGLALAMAMRALVAAAEFAGHLAGFQIGLSYSAIVDPQSGVRNNVLAALYGQIAVVTLFLVNGHHAFLRALEATYTRLPIGAGQVGESLPGAVVGMLGLVFMLGTRLAAPLVIVLVITEVALGLAARSAPALNLMASGAPVRLLIGLVLLGITAPMASGVVASMVDSVVQLGLSASTAFR